MPHFEGYIGIDYSGAQTPGDSLAGLRIFEAMHDGPPSEVPPPPSPRKYWTRRKIAEWRRRPAEHASHGPRASAEPRKEPKNHHQ